MLSLRKALREDPEFSSSISTSIASPSKRIDVSSIDKDSLKLN